MDGQRFDNLARLFGASLNRKGFLAIIAGIAAPAVLSDDVAARKRKSRNRDNGGGNVEQQGIDGGECSGFCAKDADCLDSPDCICDLETNRCQTVVCGGECLKTSDCQDFPACTCILINGPLEPGACGIDETCEGFCTKGVCNNDPQGNSCVCDFDSNLCVTIACPGFCEVNGDCQKQGQADCACFFGSGVDVTSAAEVEAATSGSGGLGTEGVPAAVCGTCLGAGLPCNGSTECCGQLVCRAPGDGLAQEGGAIGTCQHKPKPKPKKDRCGKHGHSCRRDNDCCAQAVCFKGKCGEKDSHCHNDSECAQGYSCQGGPH